MSGFEVDLNGGSVSDYSILWIGSAEAPIWRNAILTVIPTVTLTLFGGSYMAECDAHYE